MFADTAAKVFAARNIKVYLSDSYVTTPMVSFGVTRLGAMLGIVVTASHNPGTYNGIKLKVFYGGSLFDDVLKNIEDLIHLDNPFDLDQIRWDEMIERKQIEIMDIEQMYVNWINASFNL